MQSIYKLNRYSTITWC